MLAPIEAAWMFLKAQPTERDQRNMNERMEPFDASMVDSHYPYNRGEEEGPDRQETSMQPSSGAPIDAAMRQLRPRSDDEGPTLGELANMDPEEKEFYMREAGRRSAAPSPPAQRTLHDY